MGSWEDNHKNATKCPNQWNRIAINKKQIIYRIHMQSLKNVKLKILCQRDIQEKHARYTKWVNSHYMHVENGDKIY